MSLGGSGAVIGCVPRCVGEGMVWMWMWVDVDVGGCGCVRGWVYVDGVLRVWVHGNGVLLCIFLLHLPHIAHMRSTNSCSSSGCCII